MSEFPWEPPPPIKVITKKPEPGAKLSLDRQLPSSIEAEQGVLGCIFLSPMECMSECLAKLKSGPETFYDIKHQAIYKTLQEMFENKEAIDVITVQRHLKDKHQLESVGGIPYLASLPDTVPSAANLSSYLEVVREKHLLRKMLLHCYDFPNKVYEHCGEVDGLIEDFEQSAMSVSGMIVNTDEISIKELVKQRIDFYEECHQKGGGLLGISTGYPDLDRMIDGMKPAELIVLAARPSVGKTSLAMNIAENVAIDNKLPVGVFSLEMSREALVGRMISSRSRINERKLTKATANEAEMKSVFTSGVKLAHSPIFIDDTAGMSITQMRAKARRMVQKHKIKLFIIDYMQLMESPRAMGNRREEMDEVSKGVKAMAKELHVPVMAICQLNRELEKEKDRKPRASDLRESGQIEQDADIIGMLYCTDPDALRSGKDVLPVNLLIVKQRNGPTGDVPFVFFKNYTRFESAPKFEPTIKAPPQSWVPKEEQREIL